MSNLHDRKKLIQLKRFEINKQIQQEKIMWKNLFKKDPIDLRNLPSKKLILRARQIIEDISKGKPYTIYRGKRLSYNRNIISIPINIDYRLIYHDTVNGLIPKKVLNHEQYNVIKPG